MNNFNLSNYAPLTFNEKRNENNEFQNFDVDPWTPTLPNLESQSEYREDQSMPIPIPRNNVDFYSFDNSYTSHQYKAKSSWSLRKKSQDPVSKNVFFTTDRNFINIKEALNLNNR